MDRNINSSLHIRIKAIELLNENNIDILCEINIQNLISRLDRDISLQFANLRGLAGFTCFDNARNRYRMFLDSITFENYTGRTNFTMAHELGHIILGHFENDMSNSIFIGNPYLEVEANLFADELLMPTSQIIRRRMDAIEIAETYNVSFTAAQNKIKYLKSNAIYPQEKALIHALRIVTKCPFIPAYSTYNDYKVRKLHNAWLNPDYEL